MDTQQLGGETTGWNGANDCVNSIELVQRAARFRDPERIPYDLPDEFGSDFKWVRPDSAPDWIPSIPDEDEWGCQWHRIPGDKSQGYVCRHPLARIESLSTYRWPDFSAPYRYRNAKQHIAAGVSHFRFVVVNIRISLFERLIFLRGFEQVMTDPYNNPDALHVMLENLCQMQCKAVQQFASLGAHGIYWCDDLGMQDRCLLSPKVFRKFFKPYYHRVFTCIHNTGLLALMHTCGNILELLDDLIDAGLDVIQLDQPECMGIDTLAHRFGGRICFWCPVDIQGTMMRGIPEDIRMATRYMMRTLGAFHGGFMFKWFWMPEALGHTPAAIRAMAETVVGKGRYPLRLD